MAGPYIVLRHAASVPQGARWDEYEGLWIEQPEPLPARVKHWRGPHAVAEPTGRFEVREDGVRAEVWEIRLVKES